MKPFQLFLSQVAKDAGTEGADEVIHHLYDIRRGYFEQELDFALAWLLEKRGINGVEVIFSQRLSCVGLVAEDNTTELVNLYVLDGEIILVEFPPTFTLFITG